MNDIKDTAVHRNKWNDKCVTCTYETQKNDVWKNIFRFFYYVMDSFQIIF